MRVGILFATNRTVILVLDSIMLPSLKYLPENLVVLGELFTIGCREKSPNYFINILSAARASQEEFVSSNND